MTASTLLSMRAYARHRADAKLSGGSHPAVRKAIATGRLNRALVFDGGRATPLIDVAIADQEWKDATDPMQSRMPEQSSGPGVGDFAGLDEGAGRPDVRTKPNSDMVAQLRVAQLVRLSFQGRIAQLEAQKMGGELVDAKDVDFQTRRIARTVRDAMRGVPDRYMAQLAAETDPHRVRMMLASAIDQALKELAAVIANGEAG